MIKMCDRVRIFPALLVPFVLALGGCAATPTQQSTYSLDGGKIEYSFKDVDQSGASISKSQILREIEEDIKRASGYRTLYKEYSGDSIYKVKGIKTNIAGDNIFLSYINGEYFSNTGSTYKSTQQVKYSVEINDTDDGRTISIETPKEISNSLGRSILFLPISFMLPDDSVAKDIRKINSRIFPTFSKKVEGEINVKFNDESVYANFKRILGDYESHGQELKKFDIEKEKVFNLPKGKSSIPLKVTVYPYREGAKVLYEFYYDYTLKPDGSSTYEKKDVEKLIATVQSVAVD